MAVQNNSIATGAASPTASSPHVQPKLLKTAIGYGLMLLAALAVLWLVRSYGETLVAPPLSTTQIVAAPSGATADALSHVLGALAAVIVTGLILAKVFTYLGQPPVIGEVVAGIILGPSLLGPQLSAIILPASVAPYLGLIAQLGVVLYMFIVGLELHTDQIKQRMQAVLVTSHASIVLPLVLGALLALPLYPRLSNANISFTSFALFMGVAMSITAFPVLARILADRGLAQTELGMLALSCAATDDVTAWCLLAIMVGMTKARIDSGLLVVAGTVFYIILMWIVVRPLLIRVIKRWDITTQPANAIGLVLVGVLLSALATEFIGIHAIFGAFLLGAMIPHDSGVARTVTRQLEPLVRSLLLPAFFAMTGMRTRIDWVVSVDQWLICAFIVLVATVGKLGGTMMAARLTGLNWHKAAALGALMNTRGLMELIVLNIGLDLNIISPTLFAMMVLMALATTMMTAPLLRVFTRAGLD